MWISALWYVRREKPHCSGGGSENRFRSTGLETHGPGSAVRRAQASSPRVEPGALRAGNRVAGRLLGGDARPNRVESAMGSTSADDVRTVGTDRHFVGAPQIQRLLHMVEPQKAGPTERGNAARAELADPIEFRPGPISSLLEGEVLHLIAHSDPDGFGGLAAGALAGYLIERGLPEHVAAIQLHGCESSSFAADLRVALMRRQGEWSLRGDLRVQGIPGFSFISDEGINYSLGADKGDHRVVDAANYDPMSHKRERPSLRQDQSGENVRAWMQEFPDSLLKIETMTSADEVIRSLLPAAEEVLGKRLDTLDRAWIEYEGIFDFPRSAVRRSRDEHQGTVAASRRLRLRAHRPLA